MLSKNNFHEKIRQMEEKRERFSIRKLSIGAASVLIGFAFMGFGAHSVQADEIVPDSKPATAEVTAASGSNNSAKQKEKLQAATTNATTKNEQANQTAKNDKQVATEPKQNTAAAETHEVQKTTEQKQAAGTNQTTKVDQSQNKTSSNKSTTLNKPNAKNDKQAANDQVKDQKVQITNKADKSANTVSELQKAMSQASVLKSKISLNKNLTVQQKDQLKQVDQMVSSGQAVMDRYNVQNLEGQATTVSLKDNAGNSDNRSNSASVNTQTLDINRLSKLTRSLNGILQNLSYVSGQDTQFVSNWNDLKSALNDSNVTTINLENNITATSDFTYTGTRRNVTINGVGSHTTDSWSISPREISLGDHKFELGQLKYDLDGVEISKNVSDENGLEKALGDNLISKINLKNDITVDRPIVSTNYTSKVIDGGGSIDTNGQLQNAHALNFDNNGIILLNTKVYGRLEYGSPSVNLENLNLNFDTNMKYKSGFISLAFGNVFNSYGQLRKIYTIDKINCTNVVVTNRNSSSRGLWSKSTQQLSSENANGFWISFSNVYAGAKLNGWINNNNSYGGDITFDGRNVIKGNNGKEIVLGETTFWDDSTTTGSNVNIEGSMVVGKSANVKLTSNEGFNLNNVGSNSVIDLTNTNSTGAVLTRDVQLDENCSLTIHGKRVGASIEMESGGTFVSKVDDYGANSFEFHNPKFVDFQTANQNSAPFYQNSAPFISLDSSSDMYLYTNREGNADASKNGKNEWKLRKTISINGNNLSSVHLYPEGKGGKTDRDKIASQGVASYLYQINNQASLNNLNFDSDKFKRITFGRDVLALNDAGIDNATATNVTAHVVQENNKEHLNSADQYVHLSDPSLKQSIKWINNVITEDSYNAYAQNQSNTNPVSSHAGEITVDNSGNATLNISAGTTGINDSNATIEVTYLDGSKDYVPVKVDIESAKVQENSHDNPIDVIDQPNAEYLVINASDLSQWHPKYSFVGDDGNSADAFANTSNISGDNDHKLIRTNIKVQYRNTDNTADDGTQTIKNVWLKVKKTDADRYGNDVTANTQGLILHVNAPTSEVKPDAGFTAHNIPNNIRVSYAWATENDTPDVSANGLRNGIKTVTKHVKITFTNTTDNNISSITKSLTVHVIGANATNLTHAVYGGSTIPAASEQISNAGDLATDFGTSTQSYSWYKKNEQGQYEAMTNDDFNRVTSSGDHDNAWIKVDWGDGTSQMVGLKLNLTNDAEEYTPKGQPVHTFVGKEPDPSKGIKNRNEMPKGTKYSWKKRPDITKPGKSNAMIDVTYPDGSQDQINVPVMVDRNNVAPIVQPIHTIKNVLPFPSKGIKNKNQMPRETKYTWKVKPKVNNVGKTTGIITITYPDGKTTNIEVSVYVDKTGEIKTSNMKVGDNKKHKVVKAVIVNNSIPKISSLTDEKVSVKKRLPQTGSRSEKITEVLGLAVATIGSLLGLGGTSRRKHRIR